MARAVVTDDYYAILEIPPFASLQSIRESYKKLALKFHPDKNRDKSATADFQRLVVAWETLKDDDKRAEYDRNYITITKRKWEDADGVDGLRRRGEDLDKEARSRWAEEGNLSSTMGADEAGKRGNAQAWQAIAREDYLARVRTWIEFRKPRAPQILELQRILRQQETDLEAQTEGNEEVIIRKFQDAIKLSCSSSQQTEDGTKTLARLLEARHNYRCRLAEAVVESRKRLESLFLELEKDRRRYEEDEGRARRLRIGRALELLGPRDLKEAPLFSIIDRRGKAINCWKALSRIVPATEFSAAVGPLDEGPWHVRGEWKQASGEHICGRCGQRAFDLIPECGPTQCPGCGMVACINCHRSIKLLQEYEDWVTSPLGILRDSIFSVVF